MKLSVVIVNYNMCRLLRQSLSALTEACKDIDYETIVIDDASSDKSITMLQSHFPDVNIIVNEKSKGIGKARNQGIRKATGEYVLLVNADTVSISNTIRSTVNYMDKHAEAGALGVRMLTPAGQYLRISKLVLTSRGARFFNLTGLAKYFPKSRLYKGVNENSFEEFETTEVDIINGAFMLIRNNVLKQIGLLDERFTHFGHDIDLSLRIRLAGYKNYYFPKTFILNFRKQLIPKLSWLYVKHFYGAMFIFAAKYLFKLPELNMPALPQIFAPKYEIER